MADLEDTITDLLMNAGERQLEPLISTLTGLRSASPHDPSAELVRLMCQLLEYDDDLRDPHAQALMDAAVTEMSRLAHIGSE